MGETIAWLLGSACGVWFGWVFWGRRARTALEYADYWREATKDAQMQALRHGAENSFRMASLLKTLAERGANSEPLGPPTAPDGAVYVGSGVWKEPPARHPSDCFCPECGNAPDKCPECRARCLKGRSYEQAGSD